MGTFLRHVNLINAYVNVWMLNGPVVVRGAKRGINI